MNDQVLLHAVVAHLLRVVERFSSRVLVGFGVVHLKGCKGRILEAYVEANDMMDYGIVLVRLEGR